MGVEKRARAVEFRVENRRISGALMVYGDISPSHRERFERGALTWPEGAPIVLNRQHDRDVAIAYMPGGGLELREEGDALTLSAELPPIPAADKALADVRSGRLMGLSIEFRCEADRRKSGIRIVERARLVGVGLVRNPSYGQSRVEARAARDARLAVWEALR